MKFLHVFSAVALVVAASSAAAQSVESSQTGIRRNMVSANPIGLLFEWYNGELEHAISNTTTLAIAASSFSDIEDNDDDLRYSVVDGIVRYYPSARALRGFSIGASVGIVNFADDDSCIDFCGEDDDGTAGTIGVRGDYVWILGRDQHFAVAAGLGAKRVLGNNFSTEALPIGRLSIGYAW
jgi:hypothetical protein